MDLNSRLFLDVNSFARHTSWLHAVAAAYIPIAVALLALLVVAGFLLARNRRSEPLAKALWAGAACLLAVAVNQPLIQAVAEPRPFVTLPHVLVLVHHAADFGFPSDHATLAGAAAAGLLLFDRRLGIAALVIGLLLAADRVYIGVHYPGDVLAGLALGAVVALGGWFLLRVPLTRLVRTLRSTRLRRLLTSS